MLSKIKSANKNVGPPKFFTLLTVQRMKEILPKYTHAHFFIRKCL